MTVVESINSLKLPVGELHAELRNLNTTHHVNDSNKSGAGKFCSMYMYAQVQNKNSEHIGKSLFKSLLGYQISQYVRLVNTPETTSYKVRVRECGLSSILTMGKHSGWFIAKWNKRKAPSHHPVPDESATVNSTTHRDATMKLKMSCWNCHGLPSSLPYINSLFEDGTHILVLSKHWPWAYELHKLNEINHMYEAVGKLDSRLMEEKDGGTDCGGIGLLWHKSIATTLISGIGSDRICGVCFTVVDGDNSLMSVIGVYLSCLDQRVDCYRNHLQELQRLISESQLLGPVTLLGDFNTHLGGLEGQQNVQGLLLQEMMERCEPSAISQGDLALGPKHTFCSGNVRTTVDYILMDVEAASMATSCITHSMDGLNTSDHLPLTASISYDACHGGQDSSFPCFRRIERISAEKN